MCAILQALTIERYSPLAASDSAVDYSCNIDVKDKDDSLIVRLKTKTGPGFWVRMSCERAVIRFMREEHKLKALEQLHDAFRIVSIYDDHPPNGYLAGCFFINYSGLIVQRDIDPEYPESVAVGVRWNEPSDEERCLKRLRFGYYPMDNGEYYFAQPKKTIRPNTSNEEIEKLIYDRVINVLPKISKISVLSIVGFKMNQTLLDALQSIDCSQLLSLIIAHCESPAYQNDLPLLLKTFEPERLFMDRYSRNMDLNDLNISHVPDLIVIHDSYESESLEPSMRHLQNITDQTLLNWTYNIPLYIYFRTYTTNITLGGIIKFIEAIIDRVSSYNYEPTFYFGQVKNDPEMEKKLIMLLRHKDLVFKFAPGSNYQIWYRDTYFDFSIHRPIFRITKDQARTRIREIRRQIMEKLDDNYVVENDQELLSKIRELKSQLFDEWENFYNVLHLYEGNLIHIEV